jgi:DNA modification methylase
MEGHVDLWVDELLLVFRGLARVLKEQGSVWLNVADSYSRHPRFGAPAKSLLLAPERLALALAGDGWIVRNRVAWTKPNPMPNSVADRLNTTWEFRLLPHPLPSVLLRSRCHPRASSFCAPRR